MIRTNPGSAIDDGRRIQRHWLVMSVLYVVIHGLIFAYGVLNPESLLAGDRADARLDTIRYVFNYIPSQLTGLVSALENNTGSNSSVLSRIIESGNPGDYVPQGLLLMLGGQYLLVSFQLLLSFLSILCLYRLIIVLGRTPTFALVGAVLYMLLPGNLMIPHQLASESLFTPLIVIGFYLLVYYVEKQSKSWLLVSGLLLLTVASFVRPQLSLYPFVLMVILAACYRQHWKRHVALVVFICFLVPACWSLFAFSQAGSFSPGEKNQAPTVSVAFYKTLKRMAVSGGFHVDPSAYPDGKMSAREFASEVLEHPVSFLKLKSTEMLVLVVNPGTYSLLAHHFELLEGAGDTAYWKELRDHKGLAGMMAEMFRHGPVLIAVMVIGSLTWGLILSGSLIGGFIFLRESFAAPATKAILVSYLFYGLLIVLVSSEVRWAHRTPVEFILVLFFVIGLQALLQRLSFQGNDSRQ